MFTGITINTFDDPDFKEDAVRELILAPMLARLGYMPTGTTRAIRSKSLKHPFIRVGTRNHPVTIVPDYTLVHEGKPLFILDAKSPKEDILDQAHVQQAYSYAMHPEIACREFGLCNGKNLAIFDVRQRDPLIVLNFQEYEAKWIDIEKHLSARYLLTPSMRHFAPDFGLALTRMGYKQTTTIVFYGVRLNVFSRVDDALYSASANILLGTTWHCASFDFPVQMLPAIVACLPPPSRAAFTDALKCAPFQAAANLLIDLDVAVRLGDVTKGHYEDFVPLLIKEVIQSRVSLEPPGLGNEGNDIPDHIFQLRKTLTIPTGEKEA